MITNKTKLSLVNRMIDADEERLEGKLAEVEALRAYLDRLYARRHKLTAELAREEAFAARDEAPIVKTQPAGVRLDGFQV